MSKLDNKLLDSINRIIAVNNDKTPTNMISSNVLAPNIILSNIVIPTINNNNNVNNNNGSTIESIPALFNDVNTATFNNVKLPANLAPSEEASIKHPFLFCSPKVPNNGERVSSIEQLKEKKVDYADVLVKTGVIVPGRSFKIDFDISKFTEKIRQNLPKSDITVDPISVDIDQSWTVIDIITRKPIYSWMNLFRESYNHLIRVSEQLAAYEAQGKVWFPLKKHLFRSLELTPLESVKVVIIGQDPFPGKSKNTGLPIAVGISFGTDRANPIPQSLANMYKVLQKTVPGFVYPSHGDISCWAKQGILLWNRCLTLEAGSSGSHRDLWGELTTRVIQHVDKTNPKCVYVLLGGDAQELDRTISSKNILKSSHPSNQGARFGFNTCDIFNDVNKILIADNKTPIDWNVR